MIMGASLSIVSILSAVAHAAAGPTVTTNVGKVEGLDVVGHPSLAEFRGIPFAKPPVGPLRWKPPQAHGGWGEETLNATAYGSRCMQAVIPLYTGEAVAEDCLFLNVVAPKDAFENGAKKLPVMLWIHGGDFIVGAGNENDIASLVASSGGNIVGVTFNYRVNVFGFLGGAEVMASTDGGGAGNFGIQDQRAAMAWVKDNIGAFGGDGNDITIFGESAGGKAVINHLAQPASFSLYQKAIIQSGTYDTGATTMANAELFYEKLLAVSGCTDLTCLVAANATSVFDAYITAIGGVGWSPVVDGVSLTDTPAALIAAKSFNKVPVIVGSNRDETGMSVFLYRAQPPNLTEAEFDSQLNMSSAMLTEVKRVYDPEVYPYPADLKGFSKWCWMWVRYTSDTIPGLSACGARWLARMLVDGGSPAVYSYLFARPSNHMGGVFAMHAAEIPYVFEQMLRDPSANTIYADSFGLPPFPNVTAGEIKLAQDMAAYWYRFAVSGNPNPSGDAAGAGAVSWPKFTTEGDTVLRLDVESAGGIQTQQGLRKAACDWQTEQSLALGVPGLNLGADDTTIPGDDEPKITDDNETSTPSETSSAFTKNAGFVLGISAAILAIGA